MAIYEIYTAPHINLKGSNSQFEQVDSLHVLKDAKNIWAFIFPLIWLLWNKLWFWAVIYALASTVIYLLVSGALPIRLPEFVSILTVIPALFLLLEGRTLLVSKLERDGWQLADIVDAPTLEDAELKFLASRENLASDNVMKNKVSIDSFSQPIISNSKVAKNSKQEDTPTFGIFSES